MLIDVQNIVSMGDEIFQDRAPELATAARHQDLGHAILLIIKHLAAAF
jgi:hypothetical protein